MRLLLVLVPLLAMASTLRAQTPAGAAPPDALAAVRSHDPLTDEDRAAIRTFVGEAITKVAAEDAGAAQDASAALRGGAEGSRPFKEFYATTTIEAVRTAIKGAKPAAATRLLALVNALGGAEGVNLFIESLADERVGVRGAAAAGLRGLREKIGQAGGDFYTRSISGLRDAAKKETLRENLRMMYRAMNYAELASPPDPRVAVAAILDVLDSRAKQAAAGQLPALGADDAGIALGGAYLKSMSDDEKKRFGAAAAMLTKSAVAAYTAGDRPLCQYRAHAGTLAELRDALELTIEEGERQMLAVFAPSPAPKLGDKLKKCDPKAIVTEWNAWAETLKRTDLTIAPPAEAEGGSNGE